MAYVTGQNSIDSLLAGESWRWNRDQAFGASATVTFSFMEAAPSYASTGDRSGFRPMNGTERGAARRALAAWSEVAAISFVEIPDSGEGGQIRLGTNVQTGSSAYAYLPTGSGGWSGDVYLNNATASNQGDFADGSYGFLTLLHETGHALGLKHPGAYDAGGNVLSGPYLPAAEDNRDHSVMSYSGTSSGVSPRTPMVYDIAAIQFLYGASRATRTGDDVYGVSGVQTVWDGGGNDTIDASGVAGGVTIDLAEGAFSSLGAARNLVIARGVTIENATGGGGGDRLLGNGAANVLAGGDGDDTLVGGDRDTLGGGGGADRVEISGFGGVVSVASAETIAGSSGADWVTLTMTGNTVALSAVETLTGSGGGDWLNLGDGGGTLSLSQVETVIGGAGGERLVLGGAADRLIVAAIETLDGGTGGDWLDLGGRGNTVTVLGVETLIGGAGIDAVTLGGGAGTVVLTAVETLTGSGDPETVELGKRGNTMAVSLIETLNGGAGGDWVTVAGTIRLSGVETVIGGAGGDAVTLGDGGATLIMAAVETLTGGAGIDQVALGARGGTVLVRGIETLTGGAGGDHLRLADGGVTLHTGAVEVLAGGGGADLVRLGDGGSTMTVWGVESLTGGSGADVVALRDGSPVWFRGGAGADTVYAPASEVLWLNWADGADGADVVAGFAEARGVLSFGGGLAQVADRNGDGFVGLRRRASGGADARTDEVVRLETRVAQLSGDGFASFRQALGPVAGGRVSPLLVLADDGASTGLYLAGDEVRMLARFEGVLLQQPHLALSG